MLLTVHAYIDTFMALGSNKPKSPKGALDQFVSIFIELLFTYSHNRLAHFLFSTAQEVGCGQLRNRTMHHQLSFQK